MSPSPSTDDFFPPQKTKIEITTMNKTMDPNQLRTLYQESASLFLLSSCKSSKSQHSKNQIIEKHHFDPVQSARSLIFHSMYNRKANNPGVNDQRCCVVSNGERIQIDNATANHSMYSQVVTLSSDVIDNEFTIMDQIFQEFRECQLDQSSIQRKAEICSNRIGKNCTLANGRYMIRSDFHCTSCGMPYFVKDGGGNELNIRLKSIRRGRTRRRRASRCIATKHTFDNEILQKHANGGGKSFAKSNSSSSSHGSKVASFMESKVALKNSHVMRRIRDGTSKHCISYVCSCGSEASYKGLKRFNTGKSDEQFDVDKSSISKKEQGKTWNNNNSVSQGINGLKRSSDDLDFLPLTLDSNKVKQNKTIILSSKKKRRTKPQKGAKSGLQDFLSSLND